MTRSSTAKPSATLVHGITAPTTIENLDEKRAEDEQHEEELRLEKG